MNGPMKEDEVLRCLSELRIWKRGGERAPHKPLLLLWAIGRALRNEPRLVRFRDAEEPIGELLRRFGPPRQTLHPGMPFWRLRNDEDLWEIPRAVSVPLTDSGDPPIADLRAVEGGLPEPLHRSLAADPGLAALLAQRLLEEHFAESFHRDILEAVGLDAAAGEAEIALWQPGRPRVSNFRTEVFSAYERRCAVCGYDIRLGDDLLGLEAAHIRWHTHGGPDEIPNGLALCVLHHRAFDRGAIGLEPEPAAGRVRVIVSREVNGHADSTGHLLRYNGRDIRLPVDSAHEPGHEYIRWHRKEVFRPPAREVRAERFGNGE